MSEQINKIEMRIQKQEEEIKRLKALKRKAESRKQAAERSQQRKNDTRKKILIGACILELSKENQETYDRVLNALDHYLIEDRDRILFNLKLRDVI